MKEPLRWLDDANTSPRLRDVLAAATSAPPLPAGLHVELSTYATGLVAQSILAKAGTGSLLGKAWFSKLAGSALAKGLAVASLMAAAGAASYVAVGEHLTATTPTDPIAGVADRAATMPGQARGNPLIEPKEVAASAADETSPAAVPVSEKQRIVQHASDDLLPTTQRPSVADEARLLETARASLASDPALSLEVVRHHQMRYPRGQLSAERELIAVDALLRLGRRDEAERRAAPRLAEDADSLYAKRFRQLLGWE